MKANCTGFSLLLLLTLVSSWCAGCKTTPKIDWDSRVGHYTYDQAVLELGPPNGSSKLSDGKTVADWIEHRSGGSFSFGVGSGGYGSHGGVGVGVGQTVPTGGSTRVLRLVFDTENKLVSWSKNF